MISSFHTRCMISMLYVFSHKMLVFSHKMYDIHALCHAGGMTSNAALSLLYGGCYDGFLEDTAAAASMHIETDPNPQSLFLHRVAVVTPLVRRS